MAYAKANPDEIDRKKYYNLTALAEIFDCKPGTLRNDIPKKYLKARKRGRTWVVLGKDALAWWNE